MLAVGNLPLPPHPGEQLRVAVTVDDGIRDLGQPFRILDILQHPEQLLRRLGTELPRCQTPHERPPFGPSTLQTLWTPSW